MTPGRESNDWVVIKLSEPRRERGLPDGFGVVVVVVVVVILRYSPRVEVEGKGLMGSTDGRRV